MFRGPIQQAQGRPRYVPLDELLEMLHGLNEQNDPSTIFIDYLGDEVEEIEKVDWFREGF